MQPDGRAASLHFLAPSRVAQPCAFRPPGRGATFVFLARKNEWKSVDGQPFQLYEYPKTWKRYFFGGTLFGLGWAMTGACPGPLFVLVGNGYLPILVVIVGALMGTIVYGLLADKLPN